LRKDIVADFNKHKDFFCPTIKEGNIVRKDGNAISDKILRHVGDTIYIVLP